MADIPTDLPPEQIQRIQRILDQVLASLRSQSRNLPSEAGLALTYDLEPEAER